MEKNHKQVKDVPEDIWAALKGQAALKRMTLSKYIVQHVLYGHLKKLGFKGLEEPK